MYRPWLRTLPRELRQKAYQLSADAKENMRATPLDEFAFRLERLLRPDSKESGREQPYGAWQAERFMRGFYAGAASVLPPGAAAANTDSRFYQNSLRYLSNLPTCSERFTYCMTAGMIYLLSDISPLDEAIFNGELGAVEDECFVYGMGYGRLAAILGHGPEFGVGSLN